MSGLSSKRHVTQTGLAISTASSAVGPLGENKRHAKFAAAFHSTRAGDIVIEASHDGTNWLEVATKATTAAKTSGFHVEWSGGFVGRMMRARFLNGAVGTADLTGFAVGSDE